MAENAFRTSIETPNDRLIVGVGGSNWETAKTIMHDVKDSVSMAQVNSLADIVGTASAVDIIESMGMYTMLDPKIHDTPNVAFERVKNMTAAGATFITVHAAGGPAMLQAAVTGREAGREQVVSPFRRQSIERIGGILGTTILTSLDDADVLSIYGADASEKAVEFARMALDCGLDGIFCSVDDLRVIRKHEALDPLVVVAAGITPAGVRKPYDQKHAATPAEAISEGADYLLVNRAITEGPHRLAESTAARRIVEEIAGVLS